MVQGRGAECMICRNSGEFFKGKGEEPEKKESGKEKKKENRRKKREAEGGGGWRLGLRVRRRPVARDGF